MIASDIVYLQAESVDEAIAAWHEYAQSGKRVRYFSGGTEIVTGARHRDDVDVLIDVKRIPELRRIPADTGNGDTLFVGAAARLSDLADQRAVPLLAAAARGVADRTARNSITFGGNLCSVLPYRETALPLLLFDATLVLASLDGLRGVPARECFRRRLQLRPGELVVGAELPAVARETGYSARRTRDPRVDYPLVTLCMACLGGSVRFAVAGAYGYPVRSLEAEQVLAAAAREEPRARAERAVAAIEDRLWDDFRGSAAYRRELLLLVLAEGLSRLEDA